VNLYALQQVGSVYLTHPHKCLSRHVAAALDFLVVMRKCIILPMKDQPTSLTGETIPDHLTWEQGISEENRDEQGIYRTPGFDLQAALNMSNAPIIEIGGPTDEPLELMEGVTLPSEPFITNIAGSNFREQGSASITSDDIGKLHVLADISSLPVKHDFFSMVIASHIPTIPVPLARELMEELTPENQEEINRWMDSFVMQEYVKATDSILAGSRNKAEASESPRIATIAQAARVLKPGGILLMREVDPADTQIAKLLGLEVSMHNTIVQQPNVYGELDPPMPTEVAFQKLPSATP
jgi:hypothetical protein